MTTSADESRVERIKIPALVITSAGPPTGTIYEGSSICCRLRSLGEKRPVLRQLQQPAQLFAILIWPDHRQVHGLLAQHAPSHPQHILARDRLDLGDDLLDGDDPAVAQLVRAVARRDRPG